MRPNVLDDTLAPYLHRYPGAALILAPCSAGYHAMIDRDDGSPIEAEGDTLSDALDKLLTELATYHAEEC